MDELAQRLAALRDDFRPPWTDVRRDLALRGVEKMQRRRRRMIVAASATGCVAAAIGLVYASGVSRSWSAREIEVASGDRGVVAPPAVAASQRLATERDPNQPLSEREPAQLADGSQATIQSNATRLFLERNRPHEIQLRLESGTAHFEVVPNTQREFRVISESVEVSVVGTAFDVERTEGRVRVAVSHGKVRVRSPGGEAYVQAGEARWFELTLERAANAAPATSKREAARKATTLPTLPKPQARLEWRSLNQSGDYEHAYRLLEAGAPVGEDVEALMEAADVARLSGHPNVAVRYLEQIIGQHRTNPATPLAAFTLGRMLLSQLARPSEAAEAFAAARELAPGGSLSQDALAREVEAWSKAGQTKQAYLRAQLFVEKYPSSRRRRLVEQYGGLESP